MPVKVGLQYIEQWKESLEAQVAAYEAEPVETGKIVFYGPSFYTRWSKKWEHIPLADALRGKSGAACCINRGFGSSCPEHQLYYYPRMIRPLAPKVLVYCPWGNSSAFGYSDEEAFWLAERVVTYASTDFPDMQIYLSGAPFTVSEAGSPLETREAFNDMLRALAAKTPNCHFFNPLEYKPLWDPANFVADGVHYNQQGYDTFTDYYRMILRDELDKF